MAEWFLGFYGISTLLGYLMPNTVYKYIICEQFVDNIFKQTKANLFAYN